jgi:glycosyltransferase involved in cell wall biosynthesis
VRVAQVTAAYQPRIGGVETHVRRIAERLGAVGDAVTVLTHQAKGQPAEEQIGDVRVLRFPLTVGLANYPVSLPLFRYLREHAADFDVVHAHSYHTLAGQAAVRAGLPLVFTPHYHGTGHSPLRALLHRGYRPAGARLFAAAAAVICVSAAERDLVAADFPQARGKIMVIPNGTDPRPAVPFQRQAGNGQRTIAAVGRLERYKNLDLVIRACQPLAATLVIVGDGPDRARLERLAAATAGRAGSVRFTGHIPERELTALLARADVVTSASDHEAFGLTLADGLAAGARVVASAIHAHREVGRLAGENAPITFADPRDTAQFSAALAAALRHGRRPPGQLRLPSWPEVTDQTRQVYESVTSSRRQVLLREPV